MPLLTASLLTAALLAAPPQRPTLDQFFRIRAPGTPVALPDGSLLLRDWPDGIWQLYRVTAGRSPDGAASYKPGEATTVRLTDFPDGLAGFSVSPDGAHAVLLNSSGGNENTQLTLMTINLKDPAATPATRPVLANTKVQAAVNCWAPDSTAFIYSANDQSPADFYLYRYDLASGKATRLVAQPGSWEAKATTRDGARVLVERFRSASDTATFELTCASGDLRDLTIRPDGAAAGATTTAACTAVGYMPDEQSALLLSDAKGGQMRLFQVDLKTGAVSEPVPGLARHEIDGATMNGSRDLLAVASNEDGYGVPHVFALPGFKPMPFPEVDRGVIGGFDFRGPTMLWSPGRTLSWSSSSARNPGWSNTTTWPVAAAQGPVTRQVTYVDSQGIDFTAFPLPELVKYPAADGLEVPAFVFFPPGHTKGRPIPFVVMYHGGPEGQSRPTFSVVQQFLLSEGFGVMLPNVRGSTGYGRAYHMMDDYRNRWNSVRDGVDAAEWLVKHGHSSPGKIATMGGSYGGFMSVACLIEDQERVEAGTRKDRLFGAGVNLVGIVNFRTFLEKTAGYRRKLREAEYGPLSDPEFLASVSCMARVDKIKVPMFIGHGFNDPRVPVEEAMQLAVALKDRGVPLQLFIAPDEGHGFQKLENRLYYYSRVSPFLREAIGN